MERKRQEWETKSGEKGWRKYKGSEEHGMETELRRKRKKQQRKSSEKGTRSVGRWRSGERRERKRMERREGEEGREGRESWSERGNEGRGTHTEG